MLTLLDVRFHYFKTTFYCILFYYRVACVSKCVEASLEDSCIACVCVCVCVCVCACVHACVYWRRLESLRKLCMRHNDSVSEVIRVPHTSSCPSQVGPRASIDGHDRFSSDDASIYASM